MGKQLLKDEVELISLEDGQIRNLNNHYETIKKLLNSLGYYNVQQQGSYGRNTIIRGYEQQADGFDLDVAVVLDGNVYDYFQIVMNIYNALKINSYYKNSDITINKKAITINVKSNFSIDITLIIKKDGKEYVYNTQNGQLEESGALKFKEAYNSANSLSTDNSLRDLSKIYKHIRDSLTDFNVPSIVLDILIYASRPNIKSGYADEMIKTIHNIEVTLRVMKNNGTYFKIKNPVDSDDYIDTKLRSEQELDRFIMLNTLVGHVIESAINNGTGFSKLSARFDSLENLANKYNRNSLNPSISSSLSKGVFGGYKVD